MTFPTIHLNGTSQAQLAEDYQNALHAIQNALDKLSETSPNGRDYYIQPDPRAIYKATEEFALRQRKLQDVRSELEQILIHIVDSPNNRNRG